MAGNIYSVPDTIHRHALEVHVLADQIRIYEEGEMVACHLPLEGSGLTRVDPAFASRGLLRLRHQTLPSQW